MILPPYHRRTRSLKWISDHLSNAIQTLDLPVTIPTAGYSSTIIGAYLMGVGGGDTLTF